MKEISLGFSSCPNDTFIFHALVHGLVGNDLFRFMPALADVEELNRMADRGELDVTKVSCHAFGHLRDRYALLRCGGALGRGCGPLLVARKPVDPLSLRGHRIAVPGRWTTAVCLLGLYDPPLLEQAVAMRFDRIMPAVAAGEVDAGLIIHEGRFTYAGHGLVPLLDLGAWWEQETKLPIPLGCIIARRGLGAETIQAVEGLVRASVRYAFDHPESSSGYVRRHAQEMEPSVIRKHIELYVNDFSLDLGREGMRAVEMFLKQAERAGLIPPSAAPLTIQK